MLHEGDVTSSLFALCVLGTIDAFSQYWPYRPIHSHTKQQMINTVFNAENPEMKTQTYTALHLSNSLPAAVLAFLMVLCKPLLPRSQRHLSKTIH